ncbi:hypothetical protein CDL12_08178 [Handroanthus impetiginosus]|uniref:J domain-containing protein n=1 Tax=Handroanthus impetiginosus TaxID=429701 RepID=A0A2G9HNT2_9LAMI|nr:hypothetical protein CDL12_08178 [Handroanthus impetiginosus]
MATISSLYDVLGVPASADEHEIKAAYRRLAKKCHPDIVAMPQKYKSAHEFLKIHAAYSTLSDPHKRAIYDRDLFRQRGGYNSSIVKLDSSDLRWSRYSGYGVQNWETDQCW